MPSSELLRCEGLPRFEAIDAEQVDQQIPALLSDLSERFSALENQLRDRLADMDSHPLSWDELMPPFHALGERLRWSWGVVTHLTAVRNTPELREAHARQQPEVVRFSNRVGQSAVLHQALRSLLEQENSTLDPTQVRILETELLSMQHRGVGLKGDEQQAFNTTSERLAALSTSFSNHVLDATQQWASSCTIESSEGARTGPGEPGCRSAQQVSARPPVPNPPPRKDLGDWDWTCRATCRSSPMPRTAICVKRSTRPT